jgi:hypothetical protein
MIDHLWETLEKVTIETNIAIDLLCPLLLKDWTY